MTSGIETEIKLQLTHAEQGTALLTKAGFEILVPRVFEENVMLDDQAGTLRASGKLLRVRRAGDLVTCTYKGPSLPGPHKQREEKEFTAASFEAVSLVFSALGYQERFRYEKYRTEFARAGQHGLAVLDETPIGCYLELEGEAEWIDRTAAELGFNTASYIASSYAKLYLQWCAANGQPVRNMVF